MRNLNGVWVIVSLLFAWFFPSMVFAQGQTLYEGEHYVYVKCPNPDGNKRCIRLINGRGNPVDAQSLAEKFGIDAFKLRAQNPASTIAVCRDPVRRGIWHMARIERAADRVTNIIWAQCPESDRRVVTVPGEILQIDANDQYPTFTSVEGAVRAASQCGVRDQDCVRRAIQSVVPPSGGQDLTSPATDPPQQPPPVLLPPPMSPSATVSNSNHVTPTATGQPSQSAPAVAKDPGSSDVSFAVWSMLIILVLSSLLTLWTLFQKSKLQKAKAKLEKELDEESTENVGLRNRIQVLEAGGQGFEQHLQDLSSQHAQALQDRESMFQNTMTQKQREIERLEQFIERLVGIYAKGLDSKQISSDLLVQTIERGVIDQIIQQAVSLYGQELVNKLRMPETRQQAWSMLSEAEVAWHKQYLEQASRLQSLLTSNPSSFRVDPTGFAALRQVSLDIELCRTSVRDELERANVSYSLSDDLMSLLSSFVSTHVHLQSELETTRRMVEVYRQGQLDALKSGRGSEEELAPASKPPDTLTGVAPPSAPLPDRKSSPSGSRIRLVGNDGNS